MVRARLLRALATAGLALGLAALSLGDPIPAAKTAGDAAVTVSAGQPIEVEIVAVRGWQTTGVKLEAGVTYSVTATGTWSVGLQCGRSDANGTGTTILCRSDVLGLGVPSGALVGRIGPAGKPFIVGANKTLRPDTAGELFLGPYDPTPFDNSGSLMVRISTEEAAIGAEPIPPHHDVL